MRILLNDRLTKNSFPATISPLLDHQITCLCESWAIEFDARHQRNELDEDAWMWTTGAKNLLLLVHRGGMSSVAVTIDQRVQGLVLFDIEPRPSRVNPEVRLVYVNYLATAPWNRHGRDGIGRYRGVGTSLFETVVQTSREWGCDGRLGLHSLNQSNEFYDRMGMRNLGSDSAHAGMSYFENVNVPSIRTGARLSTLESVADQAGRRGGIGPSSRFDIRSCRIPCDDFCSIHAPETAVSDVETIQKMDSETADRCI